MADKPLEDRMAGKRVDSDIHGRNFLTQNTKPSGHILHPEADRIVSVFPGNEKRIPGAEFPIEGVAADADGNEIAQTAGGFFKVGRPGARPVEVESAKEEEFIAGTAVMPRGSPWGGESFLWGGDAREDDSLTRRERQGPATIEFMGRPVVKVHEVPRQSHEPAVDFVSEFFPALAKGGALGLKEASEFLMKVGMAAAGDDNPQASLDAYNKWWGDIYDKIGVPEWLHRPEWSRPGFEPDGMAGQFGVGMGRVVAPMGPIGSALGAIPKISTLARLILGAAGGEAFGQTADATSFTQDILGWAGPAEREALEVARQLVLEGFSVERSDGDFVQEIKNRMTRFSEALPIEMFAEGIPAMVKFFRGLPMLRQGLQDAQAKLMAGEADEVLGGLGVDDPEEALEVVSGALAEIDEIENLPGLPDEVRAENAQINMRIQRMADENDVAAMLQGGTSEEEIKRVFGPRVAEEEWPGIFENARRRPSGSADMGGAPRPKVPAARQPRARRVAAETFIAEGNLALPEEELTFINPTLAEGWAPPSEKMSLEEAAKYLQGLAAPFATTDPDVIAGRMARMAIDGLRSRGKKFNVDFYGANYDKARAVAELSFPEIATDPNKRVAWDLMTAMFANGIDVPKNSDYVFDHFQEFLDTGRFPVIGYGKETRQMEKKFAQVNALIDRIGIDDFVKVLGTEFTVGEMKAAGLVSHLKEFDDQVFRGWKVIGPKLGSFASNLQGFTGEPTLDLWATRMASRLGWGDGLIRTASAKTIEKRFNTFRSAFTDEALEPYGLTVAEAADLSDEELLDLANRAYADFAKGDFKDKSPFNNASRALQLNTFIVDAPMSGGERVEMRDIFGRALQTIREGAGIDLDMAQLQAILWDMERDLWRQLGVRGKGSQGVHFGTEFERNALKKGIPQEKIDDALGRTRGAGPGGERVRGQRSRRTGGRVPPPSFTPKERSYFLRRQAILGARRGEYTGGAHASASGAYRGASRGDLKPVVAKQFLGRNFEGGSPVLKSFAPAKGLINPYKKLRISTPTYHELDAAHPDSIPLFVKMMEAFKADPKNEFAAGVTIFTPEEYADGYRLFVTDDGKAGFAMLGNDVRSVFNEAGGPHQAASITMLQLAVKMGARTLESFDTGLPELYAQAGFKLVARMPWYEPIKPADWNKKTFRGFKSTFTGKAGEPDYLLYVYDPEYQGSPNAETGQRVADYDEGETIRQPILADLYPEPGAESRSVEPPDGDTAAKRLALNLAPFDPEGRSLVAKFVAGVRYAGSAEDVPLSTDETAQIGYAIAKFVRVRTAEELGRDGVGKIRGRFVRMGPSGFIEISDALTGGKFLKTPEEMAEAMRENPDAWVTFPHEVGHAIEHKAVLQNHLRMIDRPATADVAETILDEMRSLSVHHRPWLWNDVGRGADRLESVSAYRNSWTELMADSVSMYMKDPGHVKEYAPEFAAFLRAHVNSHDQLSKIIQFAGMAPVLLPGVAPREREGVQ